MSNSKRTVITRSDEQTREMAGRLAKAAYPGMVIALDGDLGTGKTVFTKGFAEGLGIKQIVSSPTFTILQTYEDGRLPLYHFDVYRIADPEEMEEIGFDDYLLGDGVCLIEWACLVEELLLPETIRVRIEKEPASGDDFRRITIEGEEDVLAGMLADEPDMPPHRADERKEV